MNASHQDRHMSPQPDLHMHLQNRESSSGFPHLRLMVFSFWMQGGTNTLFVHDLVYSISTLTFNSLHSKLRWKITVLQSPHTWMSLEASAGWRIVFSHSIHLIISTQIQSVPKFTECFSKGICFHWYVRLNLVIFFPFIPLRYRFTTYSIFFDVSITAFETSTIHENKSRFQIQSRSV